jgi:hypothetical protein
MGNFFIELGVGVEMNWKCETRLEDLDPKAPIKVVCKACGLTRLESPRDLISKARLHGAYLDEVEEVLSCMGRNCRGPVELVATPVRVNIDIALSAE